MVLCLCSLHVSIASIIILCRTLWTCGKINDEYNYDNCIILLWHTLTRMKTSGLSITITSDESVVIILKTMPAPPTKEEGLVWHQQCWCSIKPHIPFTQFQSIKIRMIMSWDQILFSSLVSDTSHTLYTYSCSLPLPSADVQYSYSAIVSSISKWILHQADDCSDWRWVMHHKIW